MLKSQNILKNLCFAQTKTDEWITGVQLENTIENMTADGGTNYDQGLQQGAAAAKSARTGARKIVIFLTDGQPSFYVFLPPSSQVYLFP